MRPAQARMRAIEIDATTARRFVLGSQGLWPARRWRGRRGVVEAVREIGSVQVDPLDVVGHNHDLELLSRVDRYDSRLLEVALYRDRSLFEWGGTLHIRPTEDLPYLLPKIRTVDYLGRRARFERSHRDLMRQVLREVETRGPIGSRDLLKGAEVSSYRARHDAGLALWYLWWRGDLMIHSRDGGDRQYDLTSRLVPDRLLRPAAEAESEAHLFHRGMRRYGLPNASELYYVQKTSSYAPATVAHRRAWVERRETAGELARVDVHGWSGRSWMDAEDAPLLDALRAGDVPREWRDGVSAGAPEVTFLAPLEIVSARGRSRRLFDFEYLWEVYKPASRRRWGYYVLPMLYGERLVGRCEPVVHPRSGALHLAKLWWEGGVDPTALVGPMERALARLARFVGAPRVTLGRVGPRPFRAALLRELDPASP